MIDTREEIEGSLFFDINHATGTKPGPEDLREFMPVIWEVHPISKIMVVTEEILTSPKGRKYRILRTVQTDSYDMPEKDE